MSEQAPESNLVAHARRELGFVGMDPNDPEDFVAQNVMDIMQKFSEGGHSGGTAAYVLAVVPRLMAFENLSPITDDPAYWMEVGPEVWQCTRNPKLFSEDGGKTYYNVDDKTNITQASASSAPVETPPEEQP